MAQPDLLDQLTTPPQFAQLIVAVLEEQGIAPNHLLYGTGLSAASLPTTEDNIPYRQMLLLIARAIELSPTPDLGLIVGCRETIGTWGIVGYAIMSSPTERMASDIAIRYQRASAGILSATPFDEGKRQRVELTSLVPLGNSLQFCMEEMIAGIVTVYSQFLGRRMRLHQVALSYSAPDYAARYEELFQCRVLFEQPQNAIWVDTPTDRPMQSADPASAALCVRMAEEMLSRYHQEEDLIVQTRRILLQQPGTFPDMEEVASALAVSSRTYRRRLGALGTSFKAVLDDVRMNLAIDYLTSSSLPVEQIAMLLGYTEATNFRRAFRRVLGKAPSDYRAG